MKSFPLFYNMKFNLHMLKTLKKKFYALIKKFMKPYNFKENFFEKD